MSGAESLVTAKLRAAFEADYQAKSERGFPRVFENRSELTMPMPDELLYPRRFEQDFFPPNHIPYRLQTEETTTFLYGMSMSKCVKCNEIP